MRELKYVYIVEFWREYWEHVEYDFIAVCRNKGLADKAKADYLKEHDGAEIKEVKIKKKELT
jgi:hypothetical protein